MDQTERVAVIKRQLRCTVIEDVTSPRLVKRQKIERSDDDDDDTLSIIAEEKISSSGSLSGRLQYERAYRKLHRDLAQCRCGLRSRYLKPIGQNLQFLTGYALTGEPPHTWSEHQIAERGEELRVKSRSILLPLELMNTDEIERYTNIEGVCCWWCKHIFKGCPVGCPVSHKKVYLTDRQRRTFSERRRKRSNCSVFLTRSNKHGMFDEFKLHGYFCSYPCAKAYGLHTDFRDTSFKARLGSYFTAMLLVIVRQLRAEGILQQHYRVPPIKAAPHWSILKIFGGTMDIGEFRRSTELDNNHELTIVPDWIPIIPSGMIAMDHPVLEKTFATEYNVQVARSYYNPRAVKIPSKRKERERVRRLTNDIVKRASKKPRTPRRVKKPPRVMCTYPQKNHILICMQKK